MISELNEELERADRDVQELTEELMTKKKGKNNMADREAIESEMQAHQKKLDETKEDRDRYREEAADIRAKYETVSKEKKDIESRYLKLREEYDALEKDLWDKKDAKQKEVIYTVHNPTPTPTPTPNPNPNFNPDLDSGS